MPNANAGKEMPDTASVMPMRSGHWLRYTAETMPMPMPKITAHTMLVMVSITVGKKRSPISVDTGRRVRIEVPKSPCSMWLKKPTNCCGSGLSRPSSARTMATGCSSASLPGARRPRSAGGLWDSAAAGRTIHQKTRNRRSVRHGNRVDVDVRVRHDVDTRQALGVRRKVLLRHQRHARQVLADLFLRGLVERGLFLVVHRDQRLGECVVDHVALVERH